VNGLSDFTVSAWVNPASNAAWQRVFDFGTGTNTNMFMTVNAGGAGLRFAIITSGSGGEQQLTGGGQLPLNTWSNVAVTLSGTTGTLYLNGNPVATNPNMPCTRRASVTPTTTG
jgi:Concanavalin A-like lectin/glucanases superfamily